MRKKLSLTLFILSFLSASLIARADSSYYFSASGSDSFSFSLPASPTTGVVDPLPGHFGFYIDPIPVTVDNTVYDVRAEFYASANSGGVDFFESGTSTYFKGISLSGPQLFTGSLDAPTFVLGTFTLTNFFTGGSTILVVTSAPPTAPVPEPSVLLLLGTGMTGVLGLRRANKERARS